MYYLPHLYDKQDCVQRINKEEIEEFDSAIGELPGDFTPDFSDFARTVIPNNVLYYRAYKSLIQGMVNV